MKNNIYVKFSNDQVISVELERDEKYELSFWNFGYFKCI